MKRRSGYTVDPTRFTNQLQKILGQEEQLQHWEGYPLGAAETILDRSAPPYHTACPNPFLEDFVALWSQTDQADNPEPAQPALTQSERNHPSLAINPGVKTGIPYLLHTYHSKLPPTTLATLIDHYCAAGDVILDPFAGSGMTGIAAQQVAAEQGKRLLCIQNDLSPAATFIASNYAAMVDAAQLKADGRALLAETANALDTLYCDDQGEIAYTIFSDVFLCTACGAETVFWDACVDQSTWTFHKQFRCQTCGAVIHKRRSARKQATYHDPLLATLVTQAVQVPVARKRGQRLELLHGVEREEAQDSPLHFNGCHVPIVQLQGGVNLSQPQKSHGISHVHHLFTWRNLSALGLLWEQALAYPSAPILQFILTSFMLKTGSKLHNIGLKNGAINLAGQLPNTYYLPNLSAERHIGKLFAKKLDQAVGYYAERTRPRHHTAATILTSTGSATQLPLADSSVDYCITDPPFGGFVNYAELNFVWEAWLGIYSARTAEAIVNVAGNNALGDAATPDYQTTMTRAFCEIYRVLKPGHWFTLIFHNSSNTIWSQIQTALQQAGFVVTDVYGLGRGQGSYKQMTANISVKTDMVVSAYKPQMATDVPGPLQLGTEEKVWALVEERLAGLPMPGNAGDEPSVIVERQKHHLFDYMVAYHVQHGLTVPFSAAAFYAGLAERFEQQNEMFFLKQERDG